MSDDTTEPQPSEWTDEVEGESRVDLPMKAQIDEIVIEGAEHTS